MDMSRMDKMDARGVFVSSLHEDGDRGVPTLDDAVSMVGAWYAHADQGCEITYPLLHLWSKTGELTVAALAVEGGGVQHAAAARALIITADPPPVLVALAGEVWMASVKGNVGDTDREAMRLEDDPVIKEWLRRRARGEHLGVVDLPRSNRMEALHVLAEDRDGRVLHATWEILPPLDEDDAEGAAPEVPLGTDPENDPPVEVTRKRRFIERARISGTGSERDAVRVKTHMLPLMVREDFLRRGRSERDARDFVRRGLRAAGLVQES